MANTYLSRTFGTDNSNVYKWTYSVWVKRNGLGEKVITSPRNSGTLNGVVKFTSGDALEVYDYRNGMILQKITSRLFRDTSAWYHIVVSNDNSVSSPETEIYVNGVKETSFSTTNEYPQNETNSFNNNYANYIGQNGASSQYFDGSMSHFHFIDGTAYDATAFGEYDANGVWKIKTSPSVTYGTNGFFILKDGNSVTDQSGNTNNFTVGGGTLTNTEDSPSNVFATWNPLDNFYASATFGSGNTGLDSGGSGIETYNTSTLGMSSGKYYMELKHNGGSATPFRQLIGITQNPTDSASQYLGGSNNDSWGYYDNTGNVVHNASTVVSYSTWTQNDIIGVAVDLDNSKLFFAKNGTWQNSSNPANGTNGISIDSGFTYYFAWGDLTTHSNYCNANFGNGYFGTTAVASAGTNASGNGIFEYDVPTGYTALSTKGLNL